MEIKFVYFDEKNRVFGARRKLKTAKNSLNKKPMFLKERLPKYEAELRAEANTQGFITSTKKLFRLCIGEAKQQ